MRLSAKSARSARTAAVKSKPLGIEEWISHRPLKDDERLYLVLCNASSAAPLEHYYRLATPEAPIPVWSDTPYAGWRKLMPYVDRLNHKSPFLKWISQEQAVDWGWVAVSTHPPETVAQYLRGLTQVLMPDGSAVFFRFWDGHQLLPILDCLGENAGQLLPVFNRYWINGHHRDVQPAVGHRPQAYPWWAVPQTLLDEIAQTAPLMAVDNVMQILRDERPELYFALSEPGLRIKLNHFIRNHPSSTQSLLACTITYLTQEVAQ